MLNGHIVLGRLTTLSDVINLNGTGGEGKYTRESNKSDDWNIDILQNGIIRFFTYGKLSFDECMLSSFPIFNERRY